MLSLKQCSAEPEKSLTRSFRLIEEQGKGEGLGSFGSRQSRKSYGLWICPKEGRHEEDKSRLVFHDLELQGTNLTLHKCLLFKIDQHGCHLSLTV